MAEKDVCEIVHIKDRFNTAVGFEFNYSGHESDFDLTKLDHILLKIFDMNRDNYMGQNYHDFYFSECPDADQYLHNMLFKIDIYEFDKNYKDEYDNNFILYKIRVIQRFFLDQDECRSYTHMWSGIPIKFLQENSKETIYPNYLKYYVYRLSKSLSSLQCPHQ